MPRREVKLIDGVRRILMEHYHDKKATKTATDRLYMVADIIGHDKPLRRIDENDVSLIIQELRGRGNSNGTINRKLSVLSKLLRTAQVEWRVIDRLPYIKKLDEAPSEIHLVTKDEEQVQLEYFQEKYPIMADFYICLVDTGCRLSEIRKLHAKDIMWDDKMIRIIGDRMSNKLGDKTGQIRTVPMTRRVYQVLRRLVVTEGNLQPFMAYSRSSYRYMWDRSRHLLDKEGDKSFHIHCLRHTCATRLLKSGVSVPVVSRWLGHSNLETTMRYLRLLPEDLMEACQKMEAF